MEALPGLRDKGGNRRVEVMGRQGVLQELPNGAALFAAGVQDGPDAGVPLSARERTAALGDASVDHGGTNAPLGGIVCRRDRRIEPEPENRFPMLDHPFGQRSRLGAYAEGAHLSQPQHAVSDPEHDSIKPLLGNLLAQMPEVKQSFEIDQQTFAKPLVGLTRQRGKEFDVPNQMGQAELFWGLTLK